MIRERADEKLFSQFLRLLNCLFISDTLRPAISLAYLTGILPIVRDKVQSKLNNFREYTILDALSLAEYVGFTTDEVKTLCDEYSMDFDGTKDAVIRMVAGENIDVNVDRFMNTMDSFNSKDDVFDYLIHLGYLAYNLDDGTCRIPNREVRNEWLNDFMALEHYQGQILFFGIDYDEKDKSHTCRIRWFTKEG